jgi:uncharacterized membrane protein
MEILQHGWDITAFAAFMLVWLAYEPILRLLARGRHVINADMVVIRLMWMRRMINRPQQRLLDSQLIGHALNTGSFFASSNLILIAGAAGVLFGGDRAFRVIEDSPLLAQEPPVLFSFKLGLIAVTLARGFLSFIWAIRQLNYCVAMIGAAPTEGDETLLRAYGEAAGSALNPALSAFNGGVRAYYFALAAAAWLFGPLAFALATFGSVGLLAWRQASSPASRGVRRVRDLLEQHDASEAERASAITETEA